MARTTPDQQKTRDISPEAWDWVVQNQGMVLGMFRDWARRKAGVSLYAKGKLFTEKFAWRVPRSDVSIPYCGVSRIAFAEDMFSVALEAAATAVDDYQPRPGKTSTLEFFVKLRMFSRLTSFLPVWRDTAGSGYQNTSWRPDEDLKFDSKAGSFWIQPSRVSDDEPSREDPYATVADAEGALFGADPEDDIEQVVARQTVQKALGALTSREAWTLQMRAAGHQNQDIAAALNVSPSTATRLYETAREKAKEALGGEM